MRNATWLLGTIALIASAGCWSVPAPLPPDLVVDDPYTGEATYPMFVPVWDDGGGHVTASVVGTTATGRKVDRYLDDLVWDDDGAFAGWTAGRYPAGDYTVTVCSENESGKDCETFAIKLGGGSSNGGSGGSGGTGGNGGSGGTGGNGGAGTGSNGGWVIYNEDGSVTIILGDGNVVDNGDGDANGGGSGGGTNPPVDDCEPWTSLPAGVVVVKTGVRTVPSGIPAHPTQTFAGLSVLKDGHVLTEADLPPCQELAGIEVIVQGTGFLNNEYSRSTYKAVVTPDEVDLWVENVFWVYLSIRNMDTGVVTPFLVPM